ncbi:hypothetical protein CVIRNUC_007177 [Coccomyxa viridis]|uniref:Uncharacterized protein n=1 Tax=Coccomyxa viridis TaxID=1274662 RepID=A0AAV1I9D1_9CHLO|nr:hypothetical protein CVIRNUC_007177 [Coccomyxa viridis]
MQCQTRLNMQISLLLPTLHHSPFTALKPCRHPSISRQSLCKPPRGFLDSLFGRQSSSDLHPDGPLFAPIDTASEGGLGGTSDNLFGPLAVLLIGFSQYEVDAFRAFMIDMDADMVKIITCNRGLLKQSLKDALKANAGTFEQLPLGTKRAVFLSGMSGSEVQEVVSAYHDSGLPRSMWAAAVPANYDRTLGTLIEDIYGDHQLMMNLEREAAERKAAQN